METTTTNQEASLDARMLDIANNLKPAIDKLISDFENKHSVEDETLVRLTIHSEQWCASKNTGVLFDLYTRVFKDSQHQFR